MAKVEDPEIPVALLDLGVLRGVTVDGTRVLVRLRPTRLGCPGRSTMERDVAAAVKTVDPSLTVEVDWELLPWREQDVTPAGKAALESIGYAVLLGGPARCPYCTSEDVRSDGEFGGALCKLPYTCRACGSTFDAMRSALACGHCIREQTAG
ncbi:MAG: DUF59 domain-containing protein [Betaproteobacteria bacterium]|nr:MAG: DUF59 domain-containing protein [Betaproteobacteria bacterium]